MQEYLGLKILKVLTILRACSVLVSTDVAAMGLDVSDLNLCINIGKIWGVKLRQFSILLNMSSGLPKTAWKLKQQQGRVGRNGLPAVDVSLVFPQRGTNIHWSTHVNMWSRFFLFSSKLVGSFSRPQVGCNGSCTKCKVCLLFIEGKIFFQNFPPSTC